MLRLAGVVLLMAGAAGLGLGAAGQLRRRVESLRTLTGALEQAERAELDGQLAEELDVFAQQIAAIPEAVTAGLTDYEAVLSFRENYLDGTRENGGEADMDVEALLYRVYSGTSWYRIEVLTDVMETYDTQAERRTQAVSNRREAGQPEAMVRREAELASSEMAHSLLPSSVKHSTQEYGKDLAVWCVLSIVLLLSPTLVRDRLRGTRPMQWVSRRGRAILSTQMGTALLSALVLTAVNVSVYAVPFLAQGPLRFAACGLDGIWEWGTPWFDWSYGTYLLVLVGLLLALSLGAAGLTVFLSQYSGNYIAMLLKAVPLFVAVGAVLGTWLLDMPFTFRNLGSGAVWLPRGIEAVTAGVLLALGLSLCILSCRQQKKRELL